MRVVIESRSEGERATVDIGNARVRIGRDEDCEVCLPSPFVSRQHALLYPEDGTVYLEAVGLNPTLLNGHELRAGERKTVSPGDTIFIQGHMLGILGAEDEPDETNGANRSLRAELTTLTEELHNSIIDRLDRRVVHLEKVQTPEGRRQILGVISEEVRKLHLDDRRDVRRFAAREALHNSIMERLLGRSSDADSDIPLMDDATEYGSLEQGRCSLVQRMAEDMKLALDPEHIKEDLRCVRLHFDEAFDRHHFDLSPGLIDHLTRWLLRKDICDLMFGLGPLTDLIRMPDINEIMVVSKDQIYIEKDGVLVETGRRFFSDEVTERIIERIVTPVGRRVDRSMPMVDARLPDGSRVNAVIPPLALKGPTLTIRKFSKTPLTMERLMAIGALDPRTAGFLRACIIGRKNIVISGGTGSGKTTLLNALSGWVPRRERIVTIEDNAELQLLQRHVVSLEAKPPNVEGRGEVTIRDLVRNALRMRPDRIIVGECRGPEALDMLQAMNTGHDGSMTTGHANSPADMLHRLEVMVLQAAEIPLPAIRQQMGSAIDVIVQQARLRDGSRKITSVVEVVGYDFEDGEIVVEEVFARHGERPLSFTGYLPVFLSDLIREGIVDSEELFE